MAVRIQFRRGTAAEWTSANPTLAAGELGYETDTAQIKIGNGSTNWTSLAYAAVSASYIDDAIANVVGLSPEELDTLQELAAAIGDDGDFANTVTNNISAAIETHNLDTTNVHGIANTAALETTTGSQNKANAAQANAESYADNAIASLVDSSPAALNTLNELAAAINDDANFFSTISNSIANVEANAVEYTNDQITDHNRSTNIHGITDTADLVYSSTLADYSTIVNVTDSISTHNLDTTNVHGIANTALLVDTADLGLAIDNHNSDSTDVHGIANTANLVYSSQLSGHTSSTTNVHGISNTAALIYQSDLSGHTEDTLNVHGISNTANLLYSSDLALHTSATTNVHGIADTADLITTLALDTVLEDYATLLSPSFTGTVILPADTTIGDVSGAELGYVNGVTSAIQTQLDAKLATDSANSIYAKLDGATFTGNVVLTANTTIGTVDSTEIGHLNGITSNVQDQLDAKAPIANPTFTGTVAGVTKTHVGLGNVDNTSDVNKPISNAVQTALDAKASLAGAVFIGNVEVDGNLIVDGDFTVNGNSFTASSTSIVIEDNMLQLAHNQAGNTVDLGLVVAYNDGTYQHAGIVRDVSADTWKLFKGVETDPATTVAFGEGSLDDLALNNLTAAGVVFTDGTQTKQGVPSITVITPRTASYTLANLNDRDTIIEISNTSATTLTIPADSTIDYPIGTTLDILQTNTGQVTLANAVGVTLNATPGLKLRTRWSSATLLKRAANTWVAYGDLTA